MANQLVSAPEKAKRPMLRMGPRKGSLRLSPRRIRRMAVRFVTKLLFKRDFPFESDGEEESLAVTSVGDSGKRFQ